LETNLTPLVPNHKSVQTPGMPLSARIIVSITAIGSIALIVYQIRDLLRRRRNLKHFERDEPLEKTDHWD